jgi:hypothetical protein
MEKRRTYLALAAALAAITLAGCGKSTPPVEIDAAVDQTEESLTTVLIGPGRPDYTSLAPPDKPLLVKGVHEKVYIAADEAGFIQMSRGAFTPGSVKEIEERVVKAVNRNVAKRGFSALATAFPPSPDLAQEPLALIATLSPELQETGSPQDRAQGKSKSLVLIRLIVTEASTGKILVERDYYSGNEARDVKDYHPKNP